jgi:hypothetical protein
MDPFEGWRWACSRPGRLLTNPEAVREGLPTSVYNPCLMGFRPSD